MDDEDLKKITAGLILVVLGVLAFLILKPILISLLFGIILAVVFSPVYSWLLKIIKLKNLSAFLTCLLLILIMVIPFWFLTPVLVKQSFEVYLASQQMDFVTPLKTIFPSFFTSDQFASEIGSVLHSFTTNAANSLVNSLSKLILNFPSIMLQLLVVFFTFFFIVRDKDAFFSYTKNILPFSRPLKDKLFKSSKDITFSVIYGQVLIGMLQGLIVSIGFFIFGINNAFILSLFAVLAGIFPIIGTTIVWLPVVIYLLIAGNTFAGVGIAFFGLIANFIDNILRPIFVSKFTHMHPLLVLIAMIGGFLFFGIVGFIIGPLVFAYGFIMLEVYRGKEIEGIFIRE